MIKLIKEEVLNFMIYLPKICGTCKGAQTAVDLAYEVQEKQNKNKNKKKVYVLKEILHNKEIIKYLHTKGIDRVENIDNLTKKDIVIIRAHGEPKSLYTDLECKNIEYYDATCANVKNIHNIVNKKYYEGYTIIIIGKKNHPEVIGTNGWCENTASIVENEEDINNLNFTDEEIFVVAQTTISRDKFLKLADIIKNKFKKVTVLDTICNAQKAIQDSSYELALTMDIMFIIGGENSSNTEELYQRCKSATESYKFSDINEFFDENMKNSKINKNTKIGITGGASTPKKQITEYKNLLEFIIFYKEIKGILEKEMTKVNNSFKDKKDNKIVIDLVDKFININKDGKYIRGILIALGYKIGTKKYNNDFVNLALAYETFQTSILIHDDIIDNATTRRGKDTIPTTYNNDFTKSEKDKNYESIRNHISNSMGICAGDLGFYFANKIILNSYKNNKNLHDILSYYNDIVINTIKGETIDVLLPFKEQYNFSNTKEKDIMEIYHLKTAWYTIIGPFVLGLLLSGKKDNIKEIQNILNKIGIAFQIKDDIIGIFNNAEIIGKSNQSDINEYKQTILYSYVSYTNYKDELLKYYGKNNLSEKDLEKVRNIFISSGALEYANNKMHNLFNTAYEEINNSNFIPDGIKNILLGLTTYLKIRNK